MVPVRFGVGFCWNLRIGGSALSGRSAMVPRSHNCHCGGTRLELPDVPRHATACTCTFCTKSGGLWADYAEDHPAGQPRILSDAYGKVYSASQGMNQHNFVTGEAAVDMIVSQIHNNETGVQEFPRATLIS